jgi:hypothetical protein
LLVIHLLTELIEGAQNGGSDLKRLPFPVLALALTILMTTAGSALAAKPTATVATTGGCSALTYTWSGFSKARAAEFRIHHFGIFETSRRHSPVGAAGSLQMPADVAFLSGDQYTVLGVLLDASGRPIQPSGAVWWGTC